MSNLKPLRESSRDGFARGLLDSAFLDEPPRQSLRKTAVFLGASEAAAAALAASTAAGAAPELLGSASALAAPSGAALSAGPTGGKAALFVVLKWLGAGAIVGATTAGGIDYLSERGSAPVPAPASHVSAAGSTTLQRVEPAMNPVHPAVTSTAGSDIAKPLAPAPVRDPAIKPRTPENSAPIGSSQSTNDTPALDGEIQRLDRARAALARGSSESALAELAAYENERKTTVLEREATVLRIDAMLGQGDREGARALARRYVAAHPDDPHARRLRRLLEPEGEP